MNVNNKEQWNQFIIENNGCFLQSWEWGEFQKSLGRKIWRIEVNNLKALVIKHNLPLNKNYLYCPRCLVNRDNSESFLEQIKKIAKQEKSIFFKIEPQNNFQFSIFNFQLSEKHIQPMKTIILDLNKSEEELLSQMHQKTRYNIRLAQKKGVTIEKIPNSKFQITNKFQIPNHKLQMFLDLLKKTAKKDGFHLHSEDYYRKMMEVLGGSGMVKIFLAEYDNKIIAANLVCFFGDAAIYLHGASDYNYRNLMAPYLLQWQAILDAKKHGFKYYDFYGIDEKKWPGVTRFKEGFNEQEISYPGAFDLIFQPIWYKAYNLIRKIL